MDYFAELGYLGLFIAAFLAATILPLSSELVLSALLLNDFNPVVVVALATVGNVLGSLTNYGLGFYGGFAFAKRFLKMERESFNKAQHRYQRYGLFSLLLAWVPVIGDPLTVIAGFLRVNLLWFLLLVTAGKLARYLVITSVVV